MMMKPKILCLLIVSIVIQISDGYSQDFNLMGKEFLQSKSIKPLEYSIDFKFSREKRIDNQIILESDDPPCFIVFQKVNNEYLAVAYSTTNVQFKNDSVQPAAESLLKALGNTPVGRLLKSGYNKDIPVGPLIKTHWNQDEWYNRFCPYDIRCKAGENVYAGCIAVAMGQIIRYYGKWNNFVLNARHTYNNDILSAYSTGYNWSDMIDNPISYDLEVCKLLSDLGVLVVRS